MPASNDSDTDTDTVPEPTTSNPPPSEPANEQEKQVKNEHGYILSVIMHFLRMIGMAVFNNGVNQLPPSQSPSNLHRGNDECRDEANLCKDNQPVSNVINNKTSIRNVWTAIFQTIILIVVVSIIVQVIVQVVNNPHSPPSCEMNIAENRDFNRYYGIIGEANHFVTRTADRCDSTIFFRPAFPQIVLKSDKSASSFLMLANNGTGKTQLRCEYAKSLNSNYLSIFIFNNEISGYLDRYVHEMGLHKENCPNNNCLKNWSEKEFAQLILSSLVTKLIDTYDNKTLELPKYISLDDKIDLITIICYYYNQLGVSELETFVNFFLDKPLNSHYLLSKVETEKLQVYQQGTYHDTPLLEHLKADLLKLPLLNKDFQRLNLLLSILEGEKFDVQALKKHRYSSVFQDLTKLSLFVKNKLKKTPVFIVDGIDENEYFFNAKKVNQKSSINFYRSSISIEMVALTMANHFYLSLFYPQIDGIDIEKYNKRPDNFPVLKIQWNTKSLVNYADYVLQEMNKNASETRCKAFTNFATLVNTFDTEIANIIKKIDTPRALHYFMNELIREMNDDAGRVPTPFQATLNNVQAAYKSLEVYSQA